MSEMKASSRAEARTDNAPSRNAIVSLEPHQSTGMIVVNVERGTVGGVACEIVDGRELQEKLGSKAQFTNWFDDRADQLQLIENKDYEGFKENSLKPTGGRPKAQYRLTLMAAKKIAMAEHTDAGNAVRDYFLDRERISYEAPRQDSGMSRSEITSLVKDIIAQTIPAVVAAIAALPVATPAPAQILRRRRGARPRNGSAST
jgi:phage anti-repressor protein